MAQPPALPRLYWLAPALALLLPPCLLIPFAHRMPGAVFFHDLYEASLGVAPAIGLTVLVLLFLRRRRNPGAWRSGASDAAIVLACLDLLAPAFFFVLLALVSGH